uniref:Activin_recp domain-containing protein n=1 Tax=Strongyloides papillosus TaxID=174720 RepID=A0A0N5BLD7_STREA
MKITYTIFFLAILSGTGFGSMHLEYLFRKYCDETNCELHCKKESKIGECKPVDKDIKKMDGRDRVMSECICKLSH